jgi:hypothetical protein
MSSHKVKFRQLHDGLERSCSGYLNVYMTCSGLSSWLRTLRPVVLVVGSTGKTGLPIVNASLGSGDFVRPSFLDWPRFIAHCSSKSIQRVGIFVRPTSSGVQSLARQGHRDSRARLGLRIPDELTSCPLQASGLSDTFVHVGRWYQLTFPPSLKVTLYSTALCRLSPQRLRLGWRYECNCRF